LTAKEQAERANLTLNIDATVDAINYFLAVGNPESMM